MQLHGKKLTNCRNSNMKIHVPAIWIPACRAHQLLPSDIQFVDIRHCSEDLHCCSVFSTVPIPFCEINSAVKRIQIGDGSSAKMLT